MDELVAGRGGTIADHLELLALMVGEFTSSRDLGSTLGKAVERVARYLDAEGGALFLLDADGARLRCDACFGPIELCGLVIEADQGIVGRCVATNTGRIVRDVAADPDFTGGVDSKTGFVTRSILCAPMAVKETRIGAIELVNKRGGDGRFDEDDLVILQGLGSAAALAILNTRQAEALVEQERVRHELDLAAEIQRGLLPEPRPEPFPVHGVNVPARLVSGDFYDFFEHDTGDICFAVGDVSGKGMNAALLMAKTASLFRCLGKTVRRPGRLLATLNREICETATRGMFVTMVAGVFDAHGGRVRLANAGHEPPLYRDRHGAYRAIEAEAPPLGIMALSGPEADYPETEVMLDGGTLYVFTDGVTEGYVDEAGATLGVDGLKRIFDEQAGVSAADRLGAVIGRLRQSHRALRDDLTLLAVSDAGPDRQAIGDGLLRLTFPSRPAELKRVREAVAGALAAAGCEPAMARDMVLAIDEACQNVIRHAYGNDPDGEVCLEIRKDDDSLIVLLRDFAKTVDPSRVKPRDLEDLRPGGLGTHLMQTIMDAVEFLPPQGDSGNLLRMIKKCQRGKPDEARDP